MRPVSDRFLAVVRSSHKMIARARIVSGEPTGVDPDGIEVPIVSGNVQFDANADIRGTVDLTIAATWPENVQGLVTPYGNELFIERGIDYGDGTREWVSQGYFRINTVEQATAPKGSLRITASDRTAKIVDGRLLAPIQFGANASFAGVFELLVDQVFPQGVTVEYDWDAYSEVLGRSHVVERDRYKFLRELCDAYAKDMYFDHRGHLIVADYPDTRTPVFTVNVGEGGVMTSLARSITREGVYNAVVASGEPVGESPPVSAYVVDDDPQSPTYYGTFGVVPRFFTSSFLTTTVQCHNAAESQLANVTGLPHVVNFGMVPNPALQVFDPVLLNYDANRQARVHVIDTLSIPLDAATPLTATTRQIDFSDEG